MQIEVMPNMSYPYSPDPSTIHVCEDGWGDVWWMGQFNTVRVAVKCSPNDCSTAFELSAKHALELYPGLNHEPDYEGTETEEDAEADLIYVDPGHWLASWECWISEIEDESLIEKLEKKCQEEEQ